ncbi:S-adenosyl-l-methionine hydroxide adenosyltransferase [Halobacteriales archaeon QS_4_69_34]|nr:MAG: S-adenosyl-l-methionine hydroxide adenosyltransferase [Halobacteriales archaeon QS_4_69_34]
MITLSSDFGSPYPAAMRGVLLSRTDARLVDVAHDFPRQDVRTAAFWLREVLPYFPPAVHLAVVDPGVGTARRSLVIRAGGHALVAPDNGLVLPAARALAASDPDSHKGATAAHGTDLDIYEWDAGDPASHTFHGRDVFAPAAAAVHEAGVGAIADLDCVRPADGYQELRFPEPEADEDGVTGEVLVVDGFGNAVTNVPGDVLAGRFGEQVAVNGDPAPVVRSYARVAAGERLLTVGSHGNAELAVNRGRGEAAFGVEPGSPVRLAW